jgi:hypothetical protein
MKLFAITLGSFLLFTALPACAQSPDSRSPTSPKPSDTAAGAATDASAEKKKPKKIWTNEEIGSVKGDVSVVCDSNSSPNKTADKRPSAGGAGDAHQQQVQGYRDRIQECQSQIDAIDDKRIAQLKNFKAENTAPSGGINPSQGYNMVPREDQVKQLEEKKKQLQSKIDDTEIEARKNGIDSGDLR